MELVHSDAVFRVPPGSSPDYMSNNPLLKVQVLAEQVTLCASRERYDADHIQYLFPIRSLTLYGPSGADADVLDPTLQDNKTDFQKQNVKDFLVGDAFLVRGLVSVGNWTGPFVRLSYSAGADTPLAKASAGSLGKAISVWLKVGTSATAVLTVPYNEISNRYELELWGYPNSDLGEVLANTGSADQRELKALDNGALAVRLDLVHGNVQSFARDKVDGVLIETVDPTDAMHPVLPLRIELAWSTVDGKFWDSQYGANYHYAFSMIERGWDNYLKVGASSAPHGGLGALEYRNLLSNYAPYAVKELSRALEPWMFDAFNSKQHAREFEPFLTLDYLDLHLMKDQCGIGLHRHRDNSEIFFMLQGRGLMVVGDWCKMPDRERCLELRTLRAGQLVMLRGGNLHGLMNATDEDLFLFMFGGYD
jgi:mannose-6-phosphate isomerase-like protein (cupin superfamily)